MNGLPRAIVNGCLAGMMLSGVVAPVAHAQAPASRVLIMPFETSGEPSGRWLGEASTVLLTDSLQALGLPVLRREERARAFELLRVPAVPGLSQATVIRVGRQIGASHIVIGSVELAEERITVRARSIEPDAGRLGTEIVEAGPRESIFEVYDRVASGLVPGASSEALRGVLRPPIAALEQYVKGLVAQSPAARVSFLTQALRIAPSLYRARVALWEVHAESGRHDLALDAVTAVPASDALGRQASFLASISLLALARFDDAFNVLRRLNDEQRDPALLNNLGVVQLRRGPERGGGRAVSYFNEAAGLGGADALFNLGYAYWLDGDASAAVYWLREAVRRDPADHAAHYVLGVALDATGSATEALRERELARQLSSVYADWDTKPPGQSVPRGLERVQTEFDAPPLIGRVDDLIAAAGQRDQRELAAFHLEVGRRAFEAERDTEAIAALRRAIYLAPYEHEAHLLLGRVYLRGARYEDAIAAFKISIWSSDTVDARLALATASAEVGMVDEARQQVRAVLARDPSDQQAQQLLESLSAR